MKRCLDREAYLSRLEPGDLFYGERPAGAVLICMVTAITAQVIRARRITTQEDVLFNRSSGLEIGAAGRIDSIQPLPQQLHQSMMSLERRMRLCVEEGDCRLTEDEKHGLLTIGTFHKAHLLPQE